MFFGCVKMIENISILEANEWCKFRKNPWVLNAPNRLGTSNNQLLMPII